MPIARTARARILPVARRAYNCSVAACFTGTKMEFAFALALFLLSIISGMLGIGVAILAVPVLSLGLADLVNQVHPLSLILNGVTALLSAIAFARAGLVRLRIALPLAGVATLGAPLGALAARSAPEWLIWTLYFTAVVFLCHRMLRPVAQTTTTVPTVDLRAILLIAVPAAALSGFVGVGPGFLLVPLMLHHGIEMRAAAAINAVAVTPSSFAAALPHVAHMNLETGFVLVLCAASAAGSYLGGHLAGAHVSAPTLRRVFIATILATSGLRAIRLLVA
jgi:uncharacterized membrane protein YfcA